MGLMPTGNNEVWMFRVRDRGKLYRIDMLELLKAAGITKDAWGNELPENWGDEIEKRKEKTAKPKTPAKKEKKDEKESN